MRILYIDIDSLRPDHLGCYGYHRNTSPNIDRIAKDAVRFNNCHATDVPCLPSRTALFTGRFGIHTGVINHGGAAADPFNQGPSRAFHSAIGQTNWMTCLRKAGLHTATISPFGERHSAFHWYAGFNEIHNTGKFGNERADEIEPTALAWIQRNASKDNWFLHLNLWDPHTPYRTPLEYGNPFKDAPLPSWLTDQIRQEHWHGGGPHSAREVAGFAVEPWYEEYVRSSPQQPTEMDSMAKVRAMFDGYDRGVHYADATVGRVLNALASQNALDDTVIIVSSDHGENLGELNIYGDHQTADQICTRVPLLVKWPGVTTPRTDDAFLHPFDFAATLIELLGGQVPNIWDGRPFTQPFQQNQSKGRDYLVVSQGAWSCQRAVRWADHIAIRSYHDGYHDFPDTMLFDVKTDPHEQHDLADAHPHLVNQAMTKLETWHTDMMRTATHPTDPMWTVLKEGGPLHTRNHLQPYLTRLRETGRPDFAARLAAKHPNE